MNAFLSGVISSFKEAEPRPRLVLYRSMGRHQGMLKRLVSPTGIGERIKPFIFLDELDAMPNSGPVFATHYYSGMAVLTVVLSGMVDFEDTTGKCGTIGPGGAAWMLAGAGASQDGRAVNYRRIHALQLRIALPPEDENGPASSRYLGPEEIGQEGASRVILGHYGQASGIISTRASMNLLQIKLKHGDRWRYQPPSGHNVGWVYPYSGELHTPGAVLSGELAVYEESDAAMQFQAEGDTEFLLASAVKHDYELVLGDSSAHTSREKLRRGEAELMHSGSLPSA
jgi:redox-sensitive bicupin YhaK (pirin superfamily)